PSTLANLTWGEIERRTVDMFLPVSRSVAEQTRLEKRRVPHRIIPNFIPDNAEAPENDTRALLAQLPEDDFLLYVGDLMPDKGIDVLLQAYAQLKMLGQGDSEGRQIGRASCRERGERAGVDVAGKREEKEEITGSWSVVRNV